MGWECSSLWAHKKAWPPHYLSNKRIQPRLQCKQCWCAESNGLTGSFRGRWVSKSLAPSSDQQLVSRDHALGEDGQVHPVWGAPVCSPHRTHLCDYGEVCQNHTHCARRESNGLLAGGGGLYCLCDHCDPAGVGSSQIYVPEAAEVHLRHHTVVSTDVGKYNSVVSVTLMNCLHVKR